MIEAVASIEIPASPKAVWRVLTDLAHYPEWNPFIRHASGNLEVGETLRLRVRPALGIPLVFHARITELQEYRRLRWRGTFGGAFLGSGVHSFVIEPLDEGRVRFEQRELFDGLLPWLARDLLVRQAEDGFSRMNRQLAARAASAEVASLHAHVAME